jgi:hypothetical protein
VQIRVAQHDFNSTEVDRMSSRAKIGFNLNNNGRSNNSIHCAYARFLLERTFKVVRTVFFGAQGLHGDPPLKWKVSLLSSYESNLKKEVGRTGN